MTVVRYEPWALVSRLQKEVDRLLGATTSLTVPTCVLLRDSKTASVKSSFPKRSLIAVLLGFGLTFLALYSNPPLLFKGPESIVPRKKDAAVCAEMKDSTFVHRSNGRRSATDYQKIGLWNNIVLKLRAIQTPVTIG